MRRHSANDAVATLGFVIWFTGLSGSGKTTLANLTSAELRRLGVEQVEIIDGDEFRSRMSHDLAFARDDRAKNVARMTYVAELLARNRVATLVAAISPHREDRELARQTIGHERFVEVHCDAPAEVCEARDVKGLYTQARQGLIQDFTGISAPYEAPIAPELRLNTATISCTECTKTVVAYLRDHGHILNGNTQP